MEFLKGKIEGLKYIQLDIKGDNRGNFVRAFSQKELLEGGINFHIVEINQTYTKAKGTLRGLHWQVEPNIQGKIFQCISGKIFDVIADVRPGSPTFGQWEGITLEADSGKLLFAPPGTAHGYLTLTEDTRLQYWVSGYYSQADEKGIRYNDPLFDIKWPENPLVISDKDRAWPDFKKI